MDENIPIVPPVPVQPVSPQPQPVASAPVAPPQPTVPVESVMPQIPKPKSKFLIILLIVLVLITLGLVALSAYRKYISKPTLPVSVESTTAVETLSSTTDPTADWKTYTNTKYNFVIKYPDSSEIPNVGNTIGKSDSSSVSFFHSDYANSKNNFDYSVWVIANANNETSEKFGEVSLLDLISIDKNLTVTEKGTKIINGISSYYIIFKSGSSGLDYIHHYFTNERFEYVVNMPYSTDFEKNFAAETVSTFKFTQ